MYLPSPGLAAIIDACHSGTVMDLPYSATIQGGYARWNSEYASPYVAQRKVRSV